MIHQEVDLLTVAIPDLPIVVVQAVVDTQEATRVEGVLRVEAGRATVIYFVAELEASIVAYQIR